MAASISTRLMENKITVYSPTYKRAQDIMTHEKMPYVKYVVGEFEIDEYMKHNPDLNYVLAPNSAQGSTSRIRNWILDNAKTDKIVMVDDDFSGFGRWIVNEDNRKEHKKLSNDEIVEFLIHGFNLAAEMGVKFWGVNCIQDPMSYRDYTPFKLTAFIGGPFQAFIKMDLRYDERIPLKEDYDLSLQVLNKYRKVLRFSAYHYFVKQCENQGGCAAFRTIEREKEQMQILQNKWGTKIVKTDSGNSQVKRKKQKAYDINPVIKIPIKGV